MTTKNPTAWLPQPLGYGLVTTTNQNFLVDQLSNFLVDQLGNFLVTGTRVVVSHKTPTNWSNTGA